MPKAPSVRPLHSLYTISPSVSVSFFFFCTVGRERTCILHLIQSEHLSFQRDRICLSILSPVYTPTNTQTTAYGANARCTTTQLKKEIKNLSMLFHLELRNADVLGIPVSFFPVPGLRGMMGALSLDQLCLSLSRPLHL